MSTTDVVSGATPHGDESQLARERLHFASVTEENGELKRQASLKSGDREFAVNMTPQ